MIGAEVEHEGRTERRNQKDQRREPGKEFPPIGSSVEGLPVRLPGAGYHHSAEHARSRPLFGRRIRLLVVSFSKAVSAKQEDF
jgi:hypothetical protein